MSAIRESTDQVRSAFSTMPLQTRVVGLGLVLLVIASLAYMSLGSRGADTELLFGGRTLSEQELDSVEMSFSTAGLNEWKREGRRITIPTQTRSQYLTALQKATALPISVRSSVQDAIDKSTIFESSSQRIAREMHAKQQDLGGKLSTFPEIRWASVEYDVGERQGLGRTRKQSASVVVCPEGTDCLPASRIQMIREFIRGSYAGMTADDVVVIDTNANANGLSNDPWRREKLEVEAQLEQEVRKLLRDYGEIRVATSVDLQRPDAVSHRVASDQSFSDNGITHVRGNRSTALPDSAFGNAGSTNAGSTTSGHDDLRHDDSGPGSLSADQTGGLIPPLVGLKSTYMAANTIHNLRVSVGLPESYYHRFWRYSYLRQHPAAQVVPSFTAEQLQQLRDQTRQNIQSAVMPALHGIASQHNKATLEVWDYPDVLRDERMATNYQAQAMTWLSNNWQQSALVLLGLIGLCVAVAVLRSGSPEPVTAQQNGKSLPHDTGYQYEVASNAASTIGTNRDPATGDPTAGSSATDDQGLLALVENNPAAAADVIRDWIAKAA